LEAELKVEEVVNSCPVEEVFEEEPWLRAKKPK